MALTPFGSATNNISNLPNRPAIPATTLKQKFDQIGQDTKEYLNNTLIPEIENQFVLDGEVLKKDNSTIFTPSNPYNPSTKKYVDDIAVGFIMGAIPDHSLTEEKLAFGTTIPITTPFGTTSYTKTSDGSSSPKVLITGNHYTDSNGYYVMTNPSVKVTCADGSVTQTVAVCRFFTGENPTIDNGKVVGDKLWRETNSRAIIPSHVSQTTGYKVVQLPVQFMQSGVANALAMNLTSLIIGVTVFTGAGQFIANAGNIQFSVANTLTGFTDGVAPSVDEWTAYITKGWEKTGASTWVSAVDGTTLPTTQSIDFVKSNEAPNYTGYQIAYKLSTAEPMSDIDVKIEGGNLSLEKGVNTIVVDNGIKLKEVSTQAITTDGTYAYINNTAYLQNKIESFSAVYKNGAIDSNWNYVASSGFRGNGYMRCLISNYDASATYTADYKILATQAPNIGTVALSYKTGLQEGLADAFEQINNRQIADSTLDAIVDASLYEVYETIPNVLLKWSVSGGYVYADFEFNFIAEKKIVPKITISNLQLYVGGGIDNTFTVQSALKNTKQCIIRIGSTNATTITNVRTNGILGIIKIVADARGGRP